MLTDSERFAFTAHRIHAFETTGNAYDATQTDEAIETGDTLLVHAEGVVAVAMTWSFAVTTAHGHLHSMAPLKDGDTLEIVAGSLKVEPGAIRRAAELARQLGFEIDPTVAPPSRLTATGDPPWQTIIFRPHSRLPLPRPKPA